MALDMEQIQYLTDTHKERYMMLQRFFESEYWPWLRAWAAENATDQLKRAGFASTWEANRLANGAMSAYLTLGNLETSVDNEFANYATEAREAQAVGAEEDNQ